MASDFSLLELFPLLDLLGLLLEELATLEEDFLFALEEDVLLTLEEEALSALAELEGLTALEEVASLEELAVALLLSSMALLDSAVALLDSARTYFAIRVMSSVTSLPETKGSPFLSIQATKVYPSMPWGRT